MAENKTLQKQTIHQAGYAVAAGFAAAAVVRFLPQQFWPKCPLHLVTGLYCPGCGGMRAVQDLLNGNLAGALSENALIFAIPVFIVLGFGVQYANKPALTKAYLLVFFVITGLFTILRNIPGSWLAPN